MTDLDDQLGVRKSGVKKTPEKSKFCGRLTLSLSKTNNRGIGIFNDKVSWHDKKRDRMKVPVADLFVFAIRRYSHAHGYTNKFKVTGYTTCMIKKDSDEESVKFYATEYMNGDRQYDFAMIDFLLDDGDTATCPAKILGFVRYNITSGILMPHISGNDGLSNEIPNNKSVDHNLYFIVHTPSDYISIDQLQNDFITLFTLGNIETCLYIVDADAISLFSNI